MWTRQQTSGAEKRCKFWRDLKKGYDLFLASHTPPQIAVCAEAMLQEAGSLEDSELLRIHLSVVHEETDAILPAELRLSSRKARYLVAVFIAAAAFSVGPLIFPAIV